MPNSNTLEKQMAAIETSRVLEASVMVVTGAGGAIGR
jgi:hypothetical protein